MLVRVLMPGCGVLQSHLAWLLPLALLWRCRAQPNDECGPYPNNVGPAVPIVEGEQVYREIQRNESHRWYYGNYNLTTMSLPNQYRKLIISLEPCKGVVYLFVRKTRQCYPDPFSCIDIRPGKEKRDVKNCKRTHYVSEINGTRDGAPTFFEVPLMSTQWFMSIYATEESAYTLTLLADIGAFPRPGSSGNVKARQLTESSIQLSWDEAWYRPEGTSETLRYWVYTSLLLDTDSNVTNKAIFLRSDKIMNTVCGLQNNTDTHYDIVRSDLCSFGICNTTVEGILAGKQYVFNIVVESYRGFKCAYAGLIAGTEWEVTEALAGDETVQTVGAVSGSVLAMVVLSIGLMLRITA
mmetsp:Transcript_59309/g.164016  ORF Transcript_59309/g.164016 Transcript_59309/m.164016 type:complete len:352 (-) Transcript_59309:126-1181(-)